MKTQSPEAQLRRSGIFATLIASLFILVLLAQAPSASANTARPPLGFSPITGSGIGVTFKYPYGIGVDESTGNIFVNDGGTTNAVDVLGAEGGIPVGVASPYKITGGWQFNSEPTTAVIDNGAASPNKGRLYVSDHFGRNKLKYFTRNPGTQTYELAGELLPNSGKWNELTGVAVDPQGNVYAAQYGNRTVVKFSPSGIQLAEFNVFAGDLPDSIGSLGHIAVDSAGNLFGATYMNGKACCGGEVRKYPANGLGGFGPAVTVVPNVQSGGGASAIAVDQASGKLYVALWDHVEQFDTDTLAKQGEFGYGSLQETSGVAVNSATDRVYVGDRGAKRVAVFGAEVPTPTVTVDDVNGTDPLGGTASLSGNVNAGALALSECKFEYNKADPTKPRVWESSAPCTGSVPADEAGHPVTATITGLVPGSTYRFRLVTANANGPAKSAVKTFTVPKPVVTDNATDVKGTKLTFNGKVAPGDEAVSECIFEYGTTTAYGSSVPCVGAIPPDGGVHPVTGVASGLSQGTVYHFRIKAIIGGTSVIGEDRAERTLSTVITEPASAVTGGTATLNGAVNPEGETVTECRFEYGTSVAYGNSVPCAEAVPADETNHPVTANVASLEPNGTTYHFRIAVSFGGPPVFGADKTFTTTNSTATTLDATAVTASGATLNGAINPNGAEIVGCEFEYGTTIAYGQTAACVPDGAGIGTGSSDVPVAADVSLEPGTTYHFRLKAENVKGAFFGADETLTTGGPIVGAAWSTSVVRTEALLHAEVNPNGAAATVAFEWGESAAYGNTTLATPIGSDGSVHTVSRALDGLQPGTTYHYRVVAASGEASVEGEDHTFTTYEAVGAGTSCSNQAFRSGSAAALPDCRAYEMVSPLDKGSFDVMVEPQQALSQSSADGSALAYSSQRAFGDSLSSQAQSQYIASRGPQGWESHGISPPGLTSITQGVEIGQRRQFHYYSEDLCRAWLVPFAGPKLTPDAVEGFRNLYRRDDRLCGEEKYEAFSNAKPEYLPEKNAALTYGLLFQGVSADERIAMFLGNDSLEGTGAPPQPASCSEAGQYAGCAERLYVQELGGHPRFVCVLPGGAAWPESCIAGGAPASKTESVQGAISADGSRVYWSTNGPLGGRIYLRFNPLAEGAECEGPDSPCTVDVSKGAEEGLGANQTSYFWGADPDSSAAIFSTEAGNTNSLFESSPTEGAELIVDDIESVVGMSDDAHRVYFVSKEALPGGVNSEGDQAIAGKFNLYLYETEPGPGIGDFRFVATIGSRALGPDFPELAGGNTDDQVPVSVDDDGLTMAFSSARAITGYDNADSSTGQPDRQIFVYDATARGGAGEIVCASCNPSGARPEGASTLPKAQSTTSTPTPHHQPQALSVGGDRLFFESLDALVPGDTNGRVDVYQWERDGVGGCTDAAPTFSVSAGGCVDLISSGQSGQDVDFVDASASGDDVFFVTSASLLPQDYGLRDVYDARAGGGFPPPQQPSPECEGEACQGAQEPPADPTPASATYQGPGNVSEPVAKPKCGKGKVRRGGKCVKKKPKKRAKHVRRSHR